MPGQINIFEDIFAYFLDRSLGLRFDICTCAKCRKQMADNLLRQFPPLYVNLDDPNWENIKNNAIQTNFSNIFLTINQTIDQVSKNPPHALESDPEKAFQNLISKIKEDRGIDLSLYHKFFLRRRVALRLLANKVGSYAAYLKILADNPGEYEVLFNTLSINVSDFFRDPHVWGGVKNVLQQIIAKGSAVKIWSAGCSEGEEPYSLAMLIKSINNSNVPVKIYATDIDKDALENARKGVYEFSKIDKLSKNSLQQDLGLSLDDYFDSKDDCYAVKPGLKDLIEFKYLDLTSSAFLADIDLIVCRNVFIYFTKGLQELVIDKFYRALKDKGYLIIGQSENMPLEARLIFKEAGLAERIYQKEKV